MRAQVILLSAEGIPTEEIAQRCGMSRPTVTNWRTRFRQQGIAGLYGEQRAGRPRTIDDERVAELITKVLQEKPPGATQWTTRSVVKNWLAKRPRFHVHFTPTYASWLNQVDRWFCIITQRAIRRGSFKNVRELTRKIDDFVARYNEHARPFIWTATADSILAKLERLCKGISD